jgi:hypothetical protein
MSGICVVLVEKPKKIRYYTFPCQRTEMMSDEFFQEMRRMIERKQHVFSYRSIT